MKTIVKSVDMMSKALNWITFFCFAGIMIFIVFDVLLRFLFNSPILGSYEIVERLMFCGVFCSFAYAQNQGAHIHIFLLLSHLPKTLGLIIFGLGELLATGICGVLFYAMMNQATVELTRHYVTAILKWQTFPFYVVALLGVAAFFITLLWGTLRSFIALANRSLRDELTSNWV